MVVSDVRDLAPDVFRHRLVLSYEALSDGVSPDALLDRVLAAVDEPAETTLQGGRGGVTGANRFALASSLREHRGAVLQPPAGRQGPGPMPGALLRALDLALVRRAGGMMPGDHLSPGAGAGTELVQLRPYQVGDDVRQLDPASTARTGIPHVRLQVPERALTTWLVLDVSPSMAFGTEQRLKADVAVGVAAAVARLATRRGGRAALLRAGAPEGRLLPPRGGRHAQVMIERALAEGVARDAEHGARERVVADALARALVQAGRVARRPGLVVVVSDFREEGWRGPLAALSARHSVIAVEVRDPREASLPKAGHLALVDPETGALVEVDSSRARVRERYAALEAERREAVAAGLRAARADHIVLDTGHDWLRELGRGLDRGRRRRPVCAAPTYQPGPEAGE